MMRPGGQLFNIATILPILSAISYALFQIITRKYAGRDSAYTTHFWTALVCTIILSLTLPFAWKTPEWWGWLTLIAMGLTGGLGCKLTRGCLKNAARAGGGGLRFFFRVLRFDRIGQQIALHPDRAAVREKFQLRGAFDAFRDDL